MKTLRNKKIQFHTSVPNREQICKAAADLHRGIGWLYEDAVARVDENVSIPESCFSLNGGRWVAQNTVCLSEDAYDKVLRMANARKSITGTTGTRTAIMRYLEGQILERLSRGQYTPKTQAVSCIQIIVAKQMHDKMQSLFPRKFDAENDSWSGGVARHVRKVIQSFKVEDFPQERVQKLYQEFATQTGGLHSYTKKNKLTLLEKGLRFYSVEVLKKEQEILDSIGKGQYGAKAALCYYAYKLAYENATQKRAIIAQNLQRTSQNAPETHACGMELPKNVKPIEKAQKELKKDVQTLKTDVGILKNTQKELVYAIKRLNERVFSKKKPLWWFHVLVIWTIATVLITLGISSLLN